ncbi:MAG: LysR family transcriptional regulator [Alphaproteobacteria bacterium]
MSLSHLAAMAIFAKVVETKSFTAAARDLGISKSAVSKQISGLEDRLGARLLNRTTRRLALTEIGAAFYDRCSRLVAEAEEAELEVTRMTVEPRGELRVNAPFSFGLIHVAPKLCGFLSMHPGVSLDLTFDDRFVDLVADGYDLAIRIGNLADSSLIARKLATTRVLLVAAPAYWAARGVPASPQALADHECLIYSYRQTGNVWQFGNETVRVSGRVRANNGDALRQAAVAGHGIAVLPSFIVWEDVLAGRLVPALHAYEPLPLGIYAVYPHSRHLSAKVRAFIDYLAAQYGDHAYWEDGSDLLAPQTG